MVTRLGQRLEAISHPEDLAVALVASLKDALSLTYVSVSIADDGAVPLYVSGERPAEVVDLPVRHGGRQVGVVGIGDELRALDADRRATARAAVAHAGTAIATLSLRQALDDEQQRLRDAREDERRRLSRDLHDRVGPALASLKIGLSTQRDASAADGVPVGALAGYAREVAGEVRGALAAEPVEIGPDGLAAAVERLAGRLAADGRLTVAVRSSGDVQAVAR
ncbi:MAG TPA: histidine kinase, partial [Capillimicrobium sp.]